MIVRPLNLNAIFADGYDSIALPRDTFTHLKSNIEGLRWTQDPERVFNRVPEFLLTASMERRQEKAEQEMAMNKLSLETCPPQLMEHCTALLQNKQIMGDWLIAYTPSIQFVSVWDGAEDLDWHWDGPACADFFFLIYLNNHFGWSDKFGGNLQLGRRNLDSNYLHVDKESVVFQDSIHPASRTLVCCNNQNPQFVHKVLPLSGDTERITLMIGFDMIRFSGS